MTYRGTILPSLSPLADDYVVTVCASCHKASCYLERRCCKVRKQAGNAAAGTAELTVAQLRALAAEHHAYWRAKKGDDPDMPHCIEEVTELAAHMLSKPETDASNEDRASIFASYLTKGEIGLDPVQCRDAIREVWPEAAEAIDKWLPKEAS